MNIKSPPSARTAEQALPLLLAGFLGGLLAFAFGLIAGRSLGPARFGALVATAQLYALFSVPFGAVSAAASRWVAEREAAVHGSSGSVIAALHRIARRAALILASAGLLAAPLCARAMDVRLHFALVLSLAPAISFAVFVSRGVAWGLGSFRFLAASILLEPATRLALAIAGTTLSDPSLLLGSAYPLGSLAAALVAAHPGLRLSRGASAAASPGPSADLLRLGTVYASLATLSGADVVFARAFLDQAAAGTYSAAASLAKAALIVQSAFGTVAFRHGANPSESPRAALVAAAATSVIAGLGLSPALLFPAGLLRILFGPAFEPGALALRWLAGGIILLAPSTVLLQFHLARERSWRVPIELTACAALTAAAIARYHRTPVELAQSFLLGCLFVALTAASHVLRDRLAIRARSIQATGDHSAPESRKELKEDRGGA